MSANQQYYLNRELSWLDFNQRVLDEALRGDRPLLERLKFLAITASNLDEFFMVRVGGLSLMRRSGSRQRDITGMTPAQQLEAIWKRSQRMVEDQYRLLNEELMPRMLAQKLQAVKFNDLKATQIRSLEAYFDENILPILTPLAVNLDEEYLPFVPAMRLTLALELYGENDRYVVVPIPESLPRRVEVADPEAYRFVYIEDLIAEFADRLFPDEHVKNSTIFRVTRNGDIAVQEEDAIDLAGEMEDVLADRKFSDTVRLEIAKGASLSLVRMIKQLCQVGNALIIRPSGPLDLSGLMDLAFLPDFDHLRDEPWPDQQPSTRINPRESIFESIAQQDILLYHPYESFEPVLRFIEEAAEDPQVVAIKQVLYRTAKDSRIVKALIRAAQNGKSVTVLVELKARFDEARNLSRAEHLQRAGVQVVYGVQGLKTHAKITLVVRREDGRMRRYCHFGTGNYNESTSRIYTDVSYLTADQDFGNDASLFFNCVTGRSRLLRFRKLVPAPTQMKKRLLELIDSEAERARQGEPAKIIAKINSLQDQDILDALIHAAEAGVKVKINVRGICCLKPGSNKLAKNIEIVSYIDRYLEHARVFYFHHGGAPQVFIASADWMTRNLEKRVELMIPVDDSGARQRLIKILDSFFEDNTQAYQMTVDGSWVRKQPGKGEKPMRAQENIAQWIRRSAKSKIQKGLQSLEPHRPN